MRNNPQKLWDTKRNNPQKLWYTKRNNPQKLWDTIWNNPPKLLDTMRNYPPQQRIILFPLKAYMILSIATFTPKLTQQKNYGVTLYPIPQKAFFEFFKIPISLRICKTTRNPSKAAFSGSKGYDMICAGNWVIVMESGMVRVAFVGQKIYS